MAAMHHVKGQFTGKRRMAVNDFVSRVTSYLEEPRAWTMKQK